MKTKSNEKRQQILDTAYRLFSANGFDKTSMSEINAQVGGSKATIYSYFPSKEALFAECLFQNAERGLGEPALDVRASPADIAETLQRLGERFLRAACSPELVKIRRLMIAEAGRSGIGELFHERIQAQQALLAQQLDEAMDAGALRRADARVAAAQLYALWEAETFDAYILGVKSSAPSPATLTRLARRAVETFLHGYAAV